MNKLSYSELITVIKILMRVKELMDNVNSTISKEQYQRNLLTTLDSYMKLQNYLGASADLYCSISNCYSLLPATIDNTEDQTRYFELAVEWAKKAVEADPDNAWTHAFLAYIYWIANLDYKASADEYRKSVSLGPSDAGIYVMAATIHYSSPDTPVTPQEITAWLEKAVQLQPDNPDYKARLGIAYYKNGRTEEALSTWTQALLAQGILQHGLLEEIKSTLNTL